MNRFVSRLLSVALVAVSFIALADRASAADRPYKASGTARLTGLDIAGEGRASHLGHYGEAGSITSVVPIAPGVLAVAGTITYTTDEGYELHAAATGVLNLNVGTLTADLAYVGGTGRFASASGSAVLSGRFLANGDIAVSVVGTINY